MAVAVHTSSPQEALAKLFASGARASILRLFMIDPTRSYYQRQIESATGLPIRAVQRELERLTSIDLLYRHSEGNRAYYQVDNQFPLFPELRLMVLKAASPYERLRAEAATNEDVLLAFVDLERDRALIVGTSETPPSLPAVDPYEIESMGRDAFLRGLVSRTPGVHEFLTSGVDVLGRRDDVVWRRIESAGYAVAKGKGVA